MPWLPLLTPTSAFISVLIWISLHHNFSPFLTTFVMGQRPPLLDRPVTIGDDERPVPQRAREGCSCDDVVAYHSCRSGPIHCMIYCHCCYPPRSSHALSWCLVILLSSCLSDSLNDVLPIVVLLTAEMGRETPVSVRLRQAFPFYPTIRAPDYDVSLRRCTATHQHDCFWV